jgi:hypothetical protein
MLVDHPRSNYRQVPGGRCLILVSDFCIRGGPNGEHDHYVFLPLCCSYTRRFACVETFTSP